LLVIEQLNVVICSQKQEVPSEYPNITQIDAVRGGNYNTGARQKHCKMQLNRSA
jgi:hypothetical protein